MTIALQPDVDLADLLRPLVKVIDSGNGFDSQHPEYVCDPPLITSRVPLANDVLPMDAW